MSTTRPTRPARAVASETPLRSSRAGEVLHLVRTGQAATISALAGATGLARSTVTERVDLLVGAGLLVPHTAEASGRGRPAAVYDFVTDAGVLLTGQVGMSGLRVGVADLGGTLLATSGGRCRRRRGPGRPARASAPRLRPRAARGGTAGIGGDGRRRRAPRTHRARGHPGPGWRTGPTVALPPVARVVGGGLRRTGAGRPGRPPARERRASLVPPARRCPTRREGRHRRRVRRRRRRPASRRRQRHRRGDRSHRGRRCHRDVRLWQRGLSQRRRERRRTGARPCRGRARRRQRARRRRARRPRRRVCGHGGATEPAGGSARCSRAPSTCSTPTSSSCWGYLADGGDHLVAGLREGLYRGAVPAASRHVSIEAARYGDDAALRGAATAVLDEALLPSRIDALVSHLA